MIKKNQIFLNVVNIITDIMIVFACVPLSFFTRFIVMTDGVASMTFAEYMIMGAIATIVLAFTYGLFGLYGVHRRIRMVSQIWWIVLSAGINIILVFGILFLTHDVIYSRIAIALFYIYSTLLISLKKVVLRLLLKSFRKKGYNQKHVIVLGKGEGALKFIKEIGSDRELGYIIEGYIADSCDEKMGETKYLGKYDSLKELIEKKRPDEVIMAADEENSSLVSFIVEQCDSTGVKLIVIPQMFNLFSQSSKIDDWNGLPLINVRAIPLDNLGNALIKRLSDILFSIILIVLTSPLMLICAIGVKLSSKGPVLFKQQRVGKNKKLFNMYKFRSMVVNNESDTAWSSKTDSRRTKFGSFMRKTSLDELPQFFNVLKGDMSIVGPRPEIPYYVDQFKEEIPLYMVRHQIRPGITGWAQVKGLRGDTPIKDRIEHDIYYAEHWSILFDVKIIFMTIFGGKFINKEE
ncbi:MAG: undecaprenyl-phosphate glucose phosphotransferase [Clostridiales bacterium]|nr:undecaprenyl-phosphate glucose phosphotransferase [Clostridiales bacterium]